MPYDIVLRNPNKTVELPFNIAFDSGGPVPYSILLNDSFSLTDETELRSVVSRSFSDSFTLTDTVIYGAPVEDVGGRMNVIFSGQGMGVVVSQEFDGMNVLVN